MGSRADQALRTTLLQFVTAFGADVIRVILQIVLAYGASMRINSWRAQSRDWSVCNPKQESGDEISERFFPGIPPLISQAVPDIRDFTKNGSHGDEYIDDHTRSAYECEHDEEDREESHTPAEEIVGL